MEIKHILTLIPLALLSFTTLQQDLWKAPKEAKAIKNPISEKKMKASAKKGAEIFKTFCIACHGTKGLGDGPGGKALTPKPANLTVAFVQNQTDGEFFWKISNGRGFMIKWDPMIKEEDRWHLVNYIRTLKK